MFKVRLKESTQIFPKPLVVLVHPGSLCGSFQTAHDWHPNWSYYARTRRAQIWANFTFLDAHKAVILGTELDDEIGRYPDVRNAVAKAQWRYEAGSQETELRKAARHIWREHSDKTLSIHVTGAWADADDGCAWTVFREFRRLAGKAVPVKLSSLVARHNISRRHIERGPVHPLGNSAERVRWHVSRDAAAFEHNERRLQNYIRANPAWRDLGERLKFIGGTVVCPTFEEDLELILRKGKTWLPLQKQIVLARGERSRCHQNVLRLWEMNPHFRVCTGYALSKDGIWRSHSWCFDPAAYRILETTGKRIAYHGAFLGRREIRRRISECEL